MKDFQFNIALKAAAITVGIFVAFFIASGFLIFLIKTFGPGGVLLATMVTAVYGITYSFLDQKNNPPEDLLPWETEEIYR